MNGSRLRSVIVATAFTWPAFSASSTRITAGTIRTIALPLKVGSVKSGKPTQSAAFDAVPVHLAQQGGEDVADHDAEEHRQPRQEVLHRDADDQDRDQRHERDAGLFA